MFKKSIIEIDLSFNDLVQCVSFENIAKGRLGAVLVDGNNGGSEVPIVRTTTVYTGKPQTFNIHVSNLVDLIKKEYHEFTTNNALVEVYDSDYRKMGYHTDIMLDLVDDSMICLFSCYELANCTNLRKLNVKNKSSSVVQEIILENCSIVMFSTKDNARHVHQIVLDNASALHAKDAKWLSKWLGITFRMSKMTSPKNLRLATDEEKIEFYKHKMLENNKDGEYGWPEIAYTISPSDL